MTSASRTPELTFLFATIAALILACAHEPGPVAVNARQQYAAAERDAKVQQYAGVELYEAKQALESLERADRRGEDEVELDHRAYVAQRRVEIAHLAAEGGAVEAQTKTLSENRTRLQLQAREQETRAAENRAAAAEAAAAAAEAEVQDAEDQAQLSELEAAEARAESAEAQIEELKGSKETERGLVFTLTSGLFATDHAELQPGADAELARIAAFLSDHADRDVFIEGHTDSEGSDQYNLALSQRRARAVADRLVASGIATNRIHVEGLGEARPIAPNDTPAGRQQNRRVEVVITR